MNEVIKDERVAFFKASNEADENMNKSKADDMVVLKSP